MIFAYSLLQASLDWRSTRRIWDIGSLTVRNAYVTYPTISGRNCRSPERRRIPNSPGSRAYFCLKCTLSHFGRGSGGALRKLVIRNRPAPVSTVDILQGRAPSEFRSVISKSVDARPTRGRRSGGLRPTSCPGSSDVLPVYKSILCQHVWPGV